MIALVRKSGNGDGQFPAIDLSCIQFPSDTITVGALRKAHSDLFDIGFADGGPNAQPKFFLLADHRGHAEHTLGSMLYCERLIATSAYAAAKGIPSFESCVEDIKEELTEHYARYGISNGPHHAAELIRDIERQGEALANQRQP